MNDEIDLDARAEQLAEDPGFSLYNTAGWTRLYSALVEELGPEAAEHVWTGACILADRSEEDEAFYAERDREDDTA
jgi:hypothetical protein